MINKTWEEVKNFYENKFGIDPELVDIESDLEVLKLCASGSSNQSISNFLDMPITIIKDTIERYFHFSGWEKDLDINPLAIYRKTGSYRLFVIGTITKSVDTQMRMFEICNILEELEAAVNDNWI